MDTGDRSTSAKELVNAYQQLRDDLEESPGISEDSLDALRRFADDLQHFAEELRSDARMNASVLGSLSHDLRAPIGALVHQAELLSSAKLSDEVRQRSRSALADNAALLAQMLDALVELER